MRAAWDRSPSMSGRTRTSEFLGSIEEAYRSALEELIREDAVARLHRRDASLWNKGPDHDKVILNRLGWLDAPGGLQSKKGELSAFAADVRAEGFTRFEDQDVLEAFRVRFRPDRL